MSETMLDAQAGLSAEALRHMAASDAYSLLSLLIEVPTPEWIELIAHPELACDFEAIALELGASPEEAGEVAGRLAAMSAALGEGPDSLGVVRREYTRLFNHPKRPVIQLYEGVFVDAELVRAGKPSTHSFLFVNPSAEEAERAYKAAGFARTRKSSVPADGIVTELQFMGQLHLSAAKAEIEGDGQAFATAREQLASFRESRVSRWIPRFFERCVEESEIELYTLLGEAGCILMPLLGRL